MSFWSELKRRRVFRAGAAYLVVAWLLMQVADLVVPALLLPQSIVTFVVVFLILGFPVVLLLAWAFDVTPEGIRKTEESATQSASRYKVQVVLIGLLATGVLFLLADRFWLSGVSGTKSLPGIDAGLSIAVIPFDNISGDLDQDHFADGMTEELLNSLAAIDNLQVTSKTSSFTLKKSELSTPEIGELLNVGHVLEGSIRRSGSRIRVTAQLIEAASDTHLWSENYDRELSVDNILDIQTDVATNVANELRTELGFAAKAMMAGIRTNNLVALDAYYDGMEIVRDTAMGRIEADERAVFRQGVEAFERASEADPNWAPAYYGLGAMHHYYMHLDEQNLELSRDYLEQAKRLNPDYGAVYGSLGFVDTQEGKYESAEQNYDRAASLGAHPEWGQAILYFSLGRFDVAIDFYRRAAEIDPLSRHISGQLVNTYYCAGRYEDLVQAAERQVAKYPDIVAAKAYLAYGYVRTGRVEDALRVAEQVSRERGHDRGIAEVFAYAGMRDRAMKTVLAEAPEWQWWARANPAAVLGETDIAMEVLLQAESESVDHLSNIRCSAELQTLRGNPQFEALLERLDLPQ